MFCSHCSSPGHGETRCPILRRRTADVAGVTFQVMDPPLPPAVQEPTASFHVDAGHLSQMHMMLRLKEHNPSDRYCQDAFTYVGPGARKSTLSRRHGGPVSSECRWRNTPWTLKDEWICQRRHLFGNGIFPVMASRGAT